VSVADLLSSRYERFRAFGAYADPGAGALPPPATHWWSKIPKMLGIDRA